MAYRSEVEVIKNFDAILPRVGIPVLSHTLFEEAINLRDLTRFVVSSKKGDILRIPEEFEAHAIIYKIRVAMLGLSGLTSPSDTKEVLTFRRYCVRGQQNRPSNNTEA